MSWAFTRCDGVAAAECFHEDSDPQTDEEVRARGGLNDPSQPYLVVRLSRTARQNAALVVVDRSSFHNTGPEGPVSQLHVTKHSSPNNPNFHGR